MVAQTHLLLSRYFLLNRIDLLVNLSQLEILYPPPPDRSQNRMHQRDQTVAFQSVNMMAPLKDLGRPTFHPLLIQGDHFVDHRHIAIPLLLGLSDRIGITPFLLDKHMYV